MYYVTLVSLISITASLRHVVLAAEIEVLDAPPVTNDVPSSDPSPLSPEELTVASTSEEPVSNPEEADNEPPAATSRDDDERPNFVFILAEDMGYGDLACYGHPYAKTPNLDLLAAEGTKFMRSYVTGATCNPSRTGFMTSRHPSSFPNYMDGFGLQNVTTITDLLNDAGYATGHMGKWHLGDDNDPLPGTYGVQEIAIIPKRSSEPGGKDAVIFRESLAFIEKHKDQPFYLNIWGHIAHSPVEPHPSLVREFCDVKVDRNDFGYWEQDNFDYAEKLGGDITDGMRHYLADLYGLDMQIGLLMEKLRELNLDKKTVVVFTSDHGAAPVMPRQQSYPIRMMGVSGGLRGAKHTFNEGGVRVPYIVHYPGYVPGGKVNHLSIVSGLDWLPTVASIAKVDYDPNMFEGEDMSDVFFGSDRRRSSPLFWRYSKSYGPRAMLYGKWKLYLNKNDNIALYDLDADREERSNLNTVEPEVSLELQIKMQEWAESLPKKYCRKDEKNEKCPTLPRGYPFDPTVPPVKVGPPENLIQEDVSYESAALLSRSSQNFNSSGSKQKGRSDSDKICSDSSITKHPTRAPTTQNPAITTIAPTSPPVTPEIIDFTPPLGPGEANNAFDNLLDEVEVSSFEGEGGTETQDKAAETLLESEEEVEGEEKDNDAEKDTAIDEQEVEGEEKDTEKGNAIDEQEVEGEKKDNDAEKGAAIDEQEEGDDASTGVSPVQLKLIWVHLCLGYFAASVLGI